MGYVFVGFLFSWWILCADDGVQIAFEPFSFKLLLEEDADDG